MTIQAYYNPSILPQIRELMSKGYTPIQIAASLHISKQDLANWLMDPDPKFDELRREVELGITAAEAFWETKGQKAILGELRYFRESTYKLFMENRFKWSEQKQDNSIKPAEQMLSDTALEEQIKKHIEAFNNDQSRSRLTQIACGEGEEDLGKQTPICIS